MMSFTYSVNSYKKPFQDGLDDTVEPLITGLGLSGLRFIRSLLDSQKQFLFPRLVDLKDVTRRRRRTDCRRQVTAVADDKSLRLQITRHCGCR